MPTNKELESRINKMEGLLEQIAEALPKKEEKVEEVVEAKPTPVADYFKFSFAQDNKEEEKWFEQELGGTTDPVPSEIRGIVDTLLNKHFGIHMKSNSGSMAFTILVPRKYSTMSHGQWEMLHFDKRVKAISHVEGMEGVKGWVDKVFSSFTPEMQALIVADRVANP